MRWPFVRRSLLDAERHRRQQLVIEFEEMLDEAHFKEMTARLDRDKAVAGAQAANARTDQAFRDCAKLISDLRAVIWHVNRHTHPDDQRIFVGMEIRSELLWHSFRFDGTFRQALAYQLERFIDTEPDLRRSVLTAWPPERTP